MKLEWYAESVDNHLIILSATGVADPILGFPIPPLDLDVAGINAFLDGEPMEVDSEPTGSQESLSKENSPPQSPAPQSPPAFPHYPINGEDLPNLDKWIVEPVVDGSEELVTGLTEISQTIPVIKQETPSPLTLAALQSLPLASSTENLNMITDPIPAFHLPPPEVLAEMQELISQHPQEVTNLSLQLPPPDVLREMQDLINQHPENHL